MSSNDLNDKVTGLLESALSRFIVKDYSESLNELKSALMLDKENPVLLYDIGICYCRLGLFNSAIRYIKESLNLPLAYIDVNNVKKLLAYAMLKSDDLSNAEEILMDLSVFSPDDLQVMNMRAYIYEKQMKYKEAIELYKNIIKKEPEYFGAYNSIAYVMALHNVDLKTALMFAVKAIKNDNKNPAYLDTAGFIYMKLGDLTRAEKCLKKANNLMPLNGEIEGHLRDMILLKKADKNKLNG